MRLAASDEETSKKGDDEGSEEYRPQASDQSYRSSHPIAAPGNCLPSQDNSSCQYSNGGHAQTGLSSATALYLQYLEQAIGWIDRANHSLSRHLNPSE